MTSKGQEQMVGLIPIAMSVFYNNVNFAIWDLDSLKIQISNRLACSLFAMSTKVDQLLVLDIETFVNYASFDLSKEALIQILSHGDELEGCLSFTLPKNKKVDFKYKTEIIKNEQGQHIQTILFLEEFTEQKRLEEEFRKYSDWQEAILNASPFSIITTDEKGFIKSFNHTAEMMLGYLSQEVIGKFTPEIFHDRDETFKKSQEISLKKSIPFKPDFFTYVEAAIFNGRSIDEWTYIRKDETRFPVRLCVTPIYSKKHEITGFMGIAEDISHQKLLEKTVQQQTEQLVDQMKFLALGKMASGVAHEINNPLAVIRGNFDMMRSWISNNIQDPDEKHKLKNRCEKVKLSVERISSIVKSMKLFSNEYSASDVQSSKVIDIINQVLNLSSEKLIAHQIQLTLDIDNDLEIYCHFSTMGHAFLNLLNNAIDATDGSAEKWIRISVVKQNSRSVEIRMTDSGLGIPKELRKNIMDPFFTGKDLATNSGLGLSSAKGIVESHGGRLYLDESESNTTFVMTLALS